MRPGRPGRLDPTDASRHLRQARHRLSPQLAVAALLFIALGLTAGRYGYHRDELYFLVAGRHPSWGYPDQPPLVPLLAAGWDVVTGGHLWAFRLLPALAAGLVVLISSATCARLGGDRTAQVCTALVTALCTFTVAMGHLFSTSTFTLLATTLSVLLLLRAIDAPADDVRAWLLLGLAAGIAQQVQLLPGFTLLACLVGVLVAGPREVLTRRGPYLAAVIALVLAAPYLVWQAVHGWPQLTVAGDIAAGGSTSSVERWQVIPFQLVMVGPVISPLLVVGVVVLLRSEAFRAHRWLGLAYLVLLVVFTLTGGKPYYATGLIPAMLSVGVVRTLRWIGDSDRRRILSGVVLVAHAVPTLLFCLPIAPVNSFVYRVANAVNPDTGETVGWDRLTAQVSQAAQHERDSDYAGARTVVLTENYGEAGALDLARRGGTVLPPVYSGHNAYGLWGPPPEDDRTVVLVGYPTSTATAWFATCESPTTIDTGTDDDENGALIQVCTTPREPWSKLWPRIVRVG